jgi:hypothetical protein
MLLLPPPTEALGATCDAAYSYINSALHFLGSYAHAYHNQGLSVDPGCVLLLLFCHREALGATSDAAYSYINSALHFLAQPAAKDAGAVLEMCMALGQANLGVLKMLSDAHAST